ncbi:EI24 domain-containing protein [Lyngbya aestuarii]|uniref:EI24 domain-containing protein n=1 Tax=Lyngbya aestuarii TaxID=118322 RepID=UPI00403DE4BA
MLQILSGFGFLTGATYPLRVLAVLRRAPRLWSYLAIPILVNVVVGIALYAGLLLPSLRATEELEISLSNRLDSLLVNLPAWLGFLRFLSSGVDFLLDFLLIVLLFLFTGFLLVQFGTLLGAPWYGQLSEKMEELRTGKVEIVEVGIFRDIGRAILFELKKLGLGMAIGIPLLVLNLLPGLGTLMATIGGVTLTATIICLDFLDGPSERRRLSFRKKLSIVLTSLPASAGFSLVCMGLITIPLLNLITIPLCVAGGTLFWCDRVYPKLPKAGSQGKLNKTSGVPNP